MDDRAPMNKSKRSKTPKTKFNHQQKTNASPTFTSRTSLPAVPLFYSNAYADPPDCNQLPLPPASWYIVPSETTVTESKVIQSTYQSIPNSCSSQSVSSSRKYRSNQWVAAQA